MQSSRGRRSPKWYNSELQIGMGWAVQNYPPFYPPGLLFSLLELSVSISENRSCCLWVIKCTLAHMGDSYVKIKCFLHIGMCPDLLFLPELWKKKKRMSVYDHWKLHQERVMVFTQLKREEVRISCLLIFTVTIIAFGHVTWSWTEGQLITEILTLPINQSQRTTSRGNALKLNLVCLYAYVPFLGLTIAVLSYSSAHTAT